jgi:hypothetical protein
VVKIPRGKRAGVSAAVVARGSKQTVKGNKQGSGGPHLGFFSDTVSDNRAMLRALHGTKPPGAASRDGCPKRLRISTVRAVGGRVQTSGTGLTAGSRIGPSGGRSNGSDCRCDVEGDPEIWRPPSGERN